MSTSGRVPQNATRMSTRACHDALVQRALRSAFFAALAACSPKSTGTALGPAETQQIRDAVKAAQTKADAFTAAREKGLRAAWTSIDPAASTAPCPVSLPQLPLFRDWQDQTDEDRKALDVAHWRMTVVPATAVLGEPPPADEKMMQKIEREAAANGPRRDQFERQSAMLLRIAADGTVPETFKTAAEVLALATEIGSDAYWGWELSVVTTEHRHPLFNPEGFQPGEITGKALLWSFKDGRVVCAANVSATSQDRMKLEIDPKQERMQEHQVLNDDLRNQAYRAAIVGMHAVP